MFSRGREEFNRERREGEEVEEEERSESFRPIKILEEDDLSKRADTLRNRDLYSLDMRF